VETEEGLSSWWGSATGASVASLSGATYRVRYPGRLNGSGGPDYRGAVLHDGRRTLLGDVELHVRASDWRRHGHNRDHAYDNVVLHVVLADDSDGRTTLASGASVPVAVARVANSDARACALPCSHLYSQYPARVVEVLETAGIVRLLRKSRQAAEEVRGAGECSVLLRLVARAFGYSMNTAPFGELARRLCESSVEDTLRHRGATERRALVLGVAGLLPFQRCEPGIPCLQEAREYEVVWKDSGLDGCMLPGLAWRLGCMYPNNHPVRRVIGLADLLPALPGLANGIRLLACAGGVSGHSLASLESYIIVPGDSYWRTHYDFGRATRSSNVVGPAKAREVVVNALLPLAVVSAASRGDTRGLARLTAAMRAYPPCAANAVTGHMSRQLGMAGRAIPAVQAQGMLRLFQTYCSRGRCAECPLGEWPVAR